jgi:hypothetical protein
VPLDGYLPFRGSHYRAPTQLVHQRVELHADRDSVWIAHRGARVAHYERSYTSGVWLPEPVMRPEPPPPPRPAAIKTPAITPPELTDYAELSA